MEGKNNLHKKISSKELIFNVIVIIFVVILALMPTGFQENTYPDSLRAMAKVLEVDNDNVSKTISFVFEGEQVCKVEILDGPFKGRQAFAPTQVHGKTRN
jgi:uncharacterized membrane protein